MITVYGFKPGFNLPDVSPYVTKLLTYLQLVSHKNKTSPNPNPNLAYTYKRIALDGLKDAPFGKIPYIIDTSNNDHKLGDSSSIIAYLEAQYSQPLDNDLTPSDAAIGVAFERLLCEHLSWAALAYPRWQVEQGFEDYIPHLYTAGPITPEIKAMFNETRARYISQLEAQGMGRRDPGTIMEFFKRDVDALEAFLGEKTFLLGEKVRSVDASMYAVLKHAVCQPSRWEGTGYIEGKAMLMRYLERVEEVMDRDIPGESKKA